MDWFRTLGAPRPQTKANSRRSVLVPGGEFAAPPTWDFNRAVNEGYAASTWVFGCATAIADDLAKLEILVGTQDGATFREANTGQARALYRLLNEDPNPEQDGYDLREYFTLCMEIGGRAFLEVVGDGQPEELWPIVPTKIRPVVGPKGITGFVYEDGPVKVPYLPPEIVYGRYPHPTRLYDSISPLQAAGLAVDQQVLAGQWNAAFFANSALPEHLVSASEELSDEEFERLVATWRAKTSGVNRDRTMLVRAGVLTVQDLGLSHKDMQFLQQQEWAVKEILSAFKVPKIKVMLSSEDTFANAEASLENYYKGTILPKLRKFEGFVNRQLAPQFDPSGRLAIRFNTSTIPELRTDWITAAPGLVQLLDRGVVGIEESRELLGLEGPAPSDVRPAILPSEPALASRGDAPNLKAQEPTSPSSPREGGWKSYDDRQRRSTTAMQRACARLFERQRKAVVAKLGAKSRGQVKAKGVDDLFDRGRWAAETADDLEPYIEEAWSDEAAFWGQKLGVDVPVSDRVVEAIRGRAKSLGGLVTDTTYDTIKGVLETAETDGLAVAEIADRLTSMFTGWTTGRAETVARTEVVSASNAGANDAFVEAEVETKEWLATSDARTRDSHAALDGEQVAVGDVFGNGLAYPGDPAGDPAELVNCRCALLPVTES